MADEIPTPVVSPHPCGPAIATTIATTVKDLAIIAATAWMWSAGKVDSSIAIPIFVGVIGKDFGLKFTGGKNGS